MTKSWIIELNPIAEKGIILQTEKDTVELNKKTRLSLLKVKAASNFLNQICFLE